jgi:hypothetical protein
MKVEVAPIFDRSDAGELSKVVAFFLDVLRSNPDGPSFINPVSDLKINDIDFTTVYQKYVSVASALRDVKCHGCPILHSQFEQVGERMRITKKVNKLKHLVSSEALALFPEFNQRLQVRVSSLN